MSFIRSFFILIILGIAAAFFIAYSRHSLVTYQTSLIKPSITITNSVKQIAPLPPGFILYGFLPYWTLKSSTIPEKLTHVGYFSIELGKDGNFVTKTEDKKTELGWSRFHSDEYDEFFDEARKKGQKVDIVITMMDADDISSFLLDAKAQTLFQTNLKNLLLTQPVDGVNFDIEYAGTVTDELRAALTNCIRKSSETIRKTQPEAQISIDTFADAAAKKRIWDVAELSKHVDYIIMMAYDFHQRSSPLSGPVAPIFGSEKNRWDMDISKTIKAFLEVMPAEKLVLGIPLYGYEWRTTSKDPGSTTYPKTGATATYKRVQEVLGLETAVEKWDADALSPYLTYEKQGKIQTIYYENTRSLRYKLELATQAKLGGVAFWALGYEGDNTEIWDVFQ